MITLLSSIISIPCMVGQNPSFSNPTLLIENDMTAADIKACYVSYDGSKLLSAENLKFDDSLIDDTEGTIHINTNEFKYQ